MAEIEIEIDGKKLTAEPNQMIIQVADQAGIYIPRFCYHKHLSVAANCRMCLVEVEKSPKALPACATPVMPGMKVFTRSAKTIEAQRAVMEFLLINHPLDCPICDQGGECELQDLSMGYGASQSHYDECKRAQPDLDLGPLIATEMTRCIFCTRCVRFGSEIAGMREMGGTYRGEHTEIGTYIKHAMHSEVSGNIIDLCPVGALTSKPYRFTARAWELQQSPGVSPHDCLGSNLNIHTLNGVVKRIVARENDAINLTWLSDRDRFGYTGLYHADRLQEPMIKVHGKWTTTTWQHAFEFAADGLKQVIDARGADTLGALISPNATLEEHYLLQKLMRALGSSHIDHRLRESDTTDQAAMPPFPGLGCRVADLETSGGVLLIGSNLQKEQPVAALHLRKALTNGASVCVINPVDFEFNFDVCKKIIVAPHRMTMALASVVKALGGKSHDQHPAHDSAALADAANQVATQLKSKPSPRIVLGALAMHHEEASLIRALAQDIAELTGGAVGYLTDGANGAGAWLAGAVPHRGPGGVTVKSGLSATDMLAKPRDAYVLLNVEPDKDTANAAQTVAALQHASFVVSLAMYHDPMLETHADVMLPMSAFTESAGTYVNTAGEWQSVKGVAMPAGSSRPAWKILRVLGNFLHADGFGFETADDVRHEIQACLEHAPVLTPSAQTGCRTASAEQTLSRIGEIPLYAVDSLVRRATPLQDAQTVMEGDVAALRMHPATGASLGVKQGEAVMAQQAGGKATLTVVFDEKIPAQAVWVAGGIEATRSLGQLFGSISVSKVTHG